MLWKEGLPVQNRHFGQARFLRFQCLFQREALREAALYAPKPGKARPGLITRTMALEQLPRLHVRRAEYREDR